jgi:hypothetical protein
VTTLSAEASNAGRFAALALPALRGIGWPQVRAALLLGFAMTAWNWTVWLQPIMEISQTMPFGRSLLGALIADQIRALCLVLAIVIADRAVDEGARRRRAYLLAAVFGCLAGFLVAEPMDWAWRTYELPDRWPADWPWLHGTPALFHWPLFHLTQWLPAAGAVVFLYADRRAARRTAELLQTAELDRIRRSKIALESRLSAMQARVEPQFLFNTLTQVERLYELDARLAAQMMDDLIAYLRAAMPHMRDTSSSMAQEIALVRAYLDIVRLRLDGRLDLDIIVAKDIAGTRMPPMMLLPLIDYAVVRGFGLTSTAGAIRLRTDAADGRLRLTITANGTGFAPEADGEGLAAIRERLTALYGDEGTLQFERLDSRSTEAVLDIPLEHRSAGR